MYATINKSDFMDQFRVMGRLEQFSYEAMGLLFDYIEEFDDDMEMDIIAVCCEYSEDSADYIASNYMDAGEYEEFKALDDDEQEDTIREYLNDNTMLVGETPSGFVYQQF